MAIVYQSHDVNLLLNKNSIFCSNLSLTQDANIQHPYQINESINNRNVPNGPVNSILNIGYFFSGHDPLKDYIFTNADYPLSGYLAGLVFNQGYLESYTVNAQPHSLININAVIKICDELSGNLNKIVHSGPPTGIRQSTSNEITFNVNNNYSAFTIENIKNFNWSYKAQVNPVYFQKETGLSHINPDRVYISNKEISCDITTNTNNNNLPLTFTGDNYAIEMQINHFTGSGLSLIHI